MVSLSKMCFSCLVQFSFDAYYNVSYILFIMRLWAEYKIKNAVTVNIICISWGKKILSDIIVSGHTEFSWNSKVVISTAMLNWCSVYCELYLCSCFTAKLHALLNSSVSSQQPPSLTKPSPSHHWETNEESLSEESRLACV